MFIKFCTTEEGRQSEIIADCDQIICMPVIKIEGGNTVRVFKVRPTGGGEEIEWMASGDHKVYLVNNAGKIVECLW